MPTANAIKTINTSASYKPSNRVKLMIYLPAKDKMVQTPLKFKNILHCLNHGTEMGWLIDPDERTIFVSQPQQQTLVFDLPEQQIVVPSFASDLKLTVAEIFNWLLD
jgi:Uma2 family endonuclease